jgi:MinD-like ATPase involved in chromosome partitioning or flagellar assembly
MGTLVDMPENAVREEPLAFGLTAPQLLVCGIAVAIGAVIQLLPVWVGIQIVLTLLLAGPVLLAAILPVRGEPAYRWLLRWVRYLRGPRTVTVPRAAESHKWEISDEAQDPRVAVGAAAGGDRSVDPVATGVGRGDPPAIASDLPGEAQTPMGERAVRLKVVDPDDSEPEEQDWELAGDPSERPALIPHVLPTMRVVALAGFAGGVGRTTLAGEIATLVGSHARIRGLDGAETGVRVLVLDAARLASAVGLRLGLPPAALARARGHRVWRDPGAIADLVVATRWGADVLTLPPHPQLGEHEGAGGEPGLGLFGAAEAGELVEGAQRAGYHLLVVDLGSLLEEGHRELIDQADLVLGVVRPTLESLPDVFRLATVLRAQGMGRKLTLVASGADDDTEIRRLAREADVPVAGCVRPDPAFTTAADRGEPAWSTAPHLWADLAPVARAAWPLLPDGHPRPVRRRSVLGVVRATIPTPGASR